MVVRPPMNQLRTTRSLVFAAVILAVLLAILILEYHGFRTGNLFAADIWDPAGWKRFLHYIAIFLLITIPVMLMFSWSYTGLVLALAAAGTAWAAGPMALLAVV